MGLTPLEGLPGATCSGSIDLSLVFYASDTSSLAQSSMKELHISLSKDILNKQAGWKSMVCTTTDFGSVAGGMHEGYKRMKLVFDLFVDRIVGYIGNYFVKLGGNVNALTLSGGDWGEE